MTNLILEIERIREIMGVDTTSNSIINEQIPPGVLVKLFGTADNAFKNVDNTKQFLDDLNKTIPAKAGKFTEQEIDNLALLLKNQSDDIARAVRTAGITSVDNFTSIKKLKDLLKKVNRTQQDALFNTYLTRLSNQIYNDVNSSWNKAFHDAINEDVIPYIKAELEEGSNLTEDYIIDYIKGEIRKKINSEFSNGPAKGKFEWSDYPDYEKWVEDTLLKEGGEFDFLIREYFTLSSENKLLGQIIPSKNRRAAFKRSKGDGTITNPDDLKNIKGPLYFNYKFVNSFFGKLGDWNGAKVAKRLEENMALFDGLKADQCCKEVLGGSADKPLYVMDEQFKYLIQNISKDLELVASYEKNLLQLWQEFIDKAKVIDSSGKIEKWMRQVPIYEKSGPYGLFWKQETLDEFMVRLRSVYKETPNAEVTAWETIWQEIQEMLATFGKIKEILFGKGGWWKKFLDIVQFMIGRRLFSAASWGLPLTPKQVGFFLSKGGFGNKGWKAFMTTRLTAYIGSWFLFTLYKKIGITIAVLLYEFSISGLEEFGLNVSDRAPGISAWDMILEKAYDEWTDFSDLYPFELGPLPPIISSLIGKGLVWGEEVLYQDQNQTEKNLESVKQKTLIDVWEALEKEGKTEKILDKLEKAKTDSPFATISSYLNKEDMFWPYFVNYNKIQETDLNKLLNARIATASVNNFFQMGSDLKTILKDKNEAKEFVNNNLVKKVDELYDVGGFRDKDNNIYTVNFKDNNRYIFTFTTSAYKYFEVYKLEDNTYGIYMDDGKEDTKPQFLDKAKLNQYGIITQNDTGTFKDKDSAEAAMKQLRNQYGETKSEPISIQELLKRL